jgi:hypothetical protein
MQSVHGAQRPLRSVLSAHATTTATAGVHDAERLHGFGSGGLGIAGVRCGARVQIHERDGQAGCRARCEDDTRFSRGDECCAGQETCPSFRLVVRRATRGASKRIAGGPKLQSGTRGRGLRGGLHKRKSDSLSTFSRPRGTKFACARNVSMPACASSAQTIGCTSECVPKVRTLGHNSLRWTARFGRALGPSPTRFLVCAPT